jgi:general secretion pathway protein I
MSLIEVLVAFVVLSMTMAVVMQIFSGGIRNARVTDHYSRALFLAQSRLAAVGAEEPLLPGEASGNGGAPLRWRISILPLDIEGGSEAQTPAVSLYQVRVRVGWTEDGRERQIELISQRMGPRP